LEKTDVETDGTVAAWPGTPTSVNETASIKSGRILAEMPAFSATSAIRCGTCLAEIWLKMEEKTIDPRAPPRERKVPIKPIATPRSLWGTCRDAVV
jgi:hypothetical protein